MRYGSWHVIGGLLTPFSHTGFNIMLLTAPRHRPTTATSMRFNSTEELTDELRRLHLVTEEQLSEAYHKAPITSDPETLLKQLEADHVLTIYQSKALRSDEKMPLVLGDSKLLYQNASGSFARVFRGCKVSNGEMVGVKVLRQRYAEEPQSVVHFRREADLCMKLRHRNIVPIYEVGEEDGFHFFTMEFVEGGNLKDFLAIRSKLSAAETFRFGVDMAEGLAYALTQGMTHRDFKMTNVLMSSTGIAKLVDFGLAGEETADGDNAVHAVEYATLEKNTGAPRNDPRSDIYFLGGVLYELISGVPPYAPTSSYEERKRFSRYTGIRPLRQVNPGIPQRACEIIDRMMRPNPHERYPDYKTLLADLRAALTQFGGDPKINAVGKVASGAISTVLCVENRTQHQDMLREYLTKHDYRVLMLSTWQRALERIKSNPPDCVVVMGDAFTSGVQTVYDEAVRWSHSKNVACVIVVPVRDQKMIEKLPLSGSVRAVMHPVKLRDVREAINASLEARALRQ